MRCAWALGWRAVLPRVERAWRALQRRPALLLLAHAMVQAWFFRRAFRAGALADVDSVAHVAYLKYLVREFHPSTGVLFGYTPQFNLGAPFLLYNVPPGTYFAGALLVKAGLSAETAIKVLLAMAYLSVAPLAFAYARSCERVRSSMPYFVAVATGLFSSDLFGLEFYFHNGMVNACLGTPIVLAVMLVLRRAWLADRALHVVLAYAGAAAGVGALVLTHLLSAYFVGLAMGALLLGESWARLGRNTLGAACTFALGCGFAAFWVVPSLPFVPDHEPIFNWIRSPRDTLAAFFDGSLITSYFWGFSSGYGSVSNVGLVAVVAGSVGVVEAWRTRNRGMLGLSLLFALAFALSLGPRWTLGLGWLPGYPRLLWHRFLTPAFLAWTQLAGYGAWRLVVVRPRLRAFGFARTILVLGGLVLCLVHLDGRSRKIETAADFPTFMRDYDEVAGWLRAHADKSGRVFGEFLAFTGRPVSVNYARQMLPIDTGLAEVGGLVYENSPASARLIERGAFWTAGALLADDAARLALKYVVAGTPQTRRAFERDARWREAVRNETFAVFEAKRFAPRIGSAGPRDVYVERQGYERGGGYSYRFRVSDGGATEFLLRANYSRAWRAVVDGQVVSTRANSDGFVTFDLPARADVVELRWDVSPLVARGERITLGAGAAAVIAIVAGAFWRPGTTRLAAISEPLGRLVLAVALTIAVFLGRRNDLSRVRQGVPFGVQVQRDPHTVELGTAREAEIGASVRIDEQAWNPAFERLGAAAREPNEAAAWHAALMLGRGARLRIDGAPEHAEVQALLGDRSNDDVYCRLNGRLSEWMPVSEGCRARGREGQGPGRVLDLRIEATGSLAVQRISVDDGTATVQAESFHNVLDLWGYDAWLSAGEAPVTPQNGMTLVADARRWGSVRLAYDGRLEPGHCAVWLLVREVPPTLASTRGTFLIQIDQQRMDRVDGVDPSPLHRPDAAPSFRWVRVGEADVHLGTRVTVSLEREAQARGGRGEFDAVAFERL